MDVANDAGAAIASSTVRVFSQEFSCDQHAFQPQPLAVLDPATNTVRSSCTQEFFLRLTRFLGGYSHLQPQPQPHHDHHAATATSNPNPNPTTTITAATATSNPNPNPTTTITAPPATPIHIEDAEVQESPTMVAAHRLRLVLGPRNLFNAGPFDVYHVQPVFNAVENFVHTFQMSDQALNRPALRFGFYVENPQQIQPSIQDELNGAISEHSLLLKEGRLELEKIINKSHWRFLFILYIIAVAFLGSASLLYYAFHQGYAVGLLLGISSLFIVFLTLFPLWRDAYSVIADAKRFALDMKEVLQIFHPTFKKEEYLSGRGHTAAGHRSNYPTRR
ncbi:hypothetical protein FB45DRAFT_1120871 [Roridomyces roridus]|uniref:Uncharacterized protein n=1 Tax=Roridomyces roridus TaxID=1738132 RepID=A0AAD7B525_9AGAR|nr:hypothetical protein FB45DRAFT_1120871 [Roridomyces roridus]